ncbi:MAG: molybdopterin molybdotransferase MoeA [Nautiliaceae bacterium]
MRKLDSLGFEESLELILEKIEPKKETKKIFISQAIGKILAQDIKAKRDLPLFTNSAMDGYAFKYNEKCKKYKVVKTIFAGDIVEGSLNECECYKIMTGAMVPKDADTVVPFEKVKEVGEFIEFEEKKGANVRLKGEEVKKGEVLLEKGRKLNFADIAMLSSQGIVNVSVYRDLKIGVVVSGNELKEPWEEVGEFELFNANGMGIVSLLKEKGFEADYLGVLPDSLEESIKFFENIKGYDVLITSGGISQGEADFILDALEENGFEKYIHGILVKPGRATLVGKLKDTLILGMPGNPLSALIQLLSLGIPVLEKLRGNKNYNFTFIEIENKIPFKLNSKKDHTILGRVEKDGFYVIDNYKYGSGMLMPFIKANAFAIVKKGKSFIESEKLKVALF